MTYGTYDILSFYCLAISFLCSILEAVFGIKLSDVEREILMFHENIPLTSVWEEMLTRKEHIALVVDEYGSFEGGVTMEDIFESILGLEILDEKDKIEDMQAYARERREERKDKYRHLDVME